MTDRPALSRQRGRRKGQWCEYLRERPAVTSEISLYIPASSTMRYSGAGGSQLTGSLSAVLQLQTRPTLPKTRSEPAAYSSCSHGVGQLATSDVYLLATLHSPTIHEREVFMGGIRGELMGQSGSTHGGQNRVDIFTSGVNGQLVSLALTGDTGTDQNRPQSVGSADARSLRELCHDLIGPAACIKLLVKAAVQEADPVTRELLQQIAGEAGRIAEVCEYFLDQFARPDPVRLDALVGEVAASARLRFVGPIDVVAQPVSVRVHPAVVIRILANLLDNACRAAGPQGRVQLVAEPAKGGALLAVADSGDGLGRGAAGRASLGLDIVRALVLEAGGSLDFGVSDLGGVCVTVTLPRAVGPGPRPSRPAGGRAGRIGRERAVERGTL